MKRIFYILSLAIVFQLVDSTVAQAQCSMCRQSAESSLKAGKSKAGKGLNPGILYLMAVPYLMTGAAFGIYYYNQRKKRNQNYQYN